MQGVSLDFASVSTGPNNTLPPSIHAISDLPSAQQPDLASTDTNALALIPASFTTGVSSYSGTSVSRDELTWLAQTDGWIGDQVMTVLLARASTLANEAARADSTPPTLLFWRPAVLETFLRRSPEERKPDLMNIAKELGLPESKSQKMFRQTAFTIVIIGSLNDRMEARKAATSSANF